MASNTFQWSGMGSRGSSRLRCLKIVVQRTAAPMLLLSVNSGALAVASSTVSWKSRSAAWPASVARVWLSIWISALRMRSSWPSSRRSAARAAAAGSTIIRNSYRPLRNSSLGSDSKNQARTSGSSRLQRLRSVTRVPVLGRLSTSPLAARMRMASR
jgi:hypothetical protein